MSNKIILNDIEIDLHEMCNLKCVHCTHSSPHFSNKDPIYSLNQFETDIETLSDISHVKSLRIVGGEPFLNKQLFDYIKIIKKYKITDNIKIFTNGILLNKADERIFESIDELRVTVYPSITKDKLDIISNNIKQIKDKFPNLLLVDNEISYFLKFNLIEENVDSSLVNKIYNKCYYSYEHRGYSIFNGRFYKCFASRKKYKFLEAHNKLTSELKKKLDPSSIDCISLDASLSVERLSTFINDKAPLEGCKWCLGTCGKLLKHEQLHSTDIHNDTATIEDLDFDTGEIYISNNILSWDRTDKKMGDMVHNKFFKIEHLKHYLKHFKFKK